LIKEGEAAETQGAFVVRGAGDISPAGGTGGISTLILTLSPERAREDVFPPLRGGIKGG
jgi:hypothetical protein